MSGASVGLFHDPWTGINARGASFRRPLALWRKVVWYKANPRSSAYMRALLAETWPGARFVDVDGDASWVEAVRDTDHVVLLYADAIGLGFFTLEWKARHANPRAEFYVLNGRRRSVVFDANTRRALYVRRFLEWTMFCECVMGLGLLLATPFLLAFDWMRGRR